MKQAFAIARVFPGDLNALVKNLMKKTNIHDPAEVVRSVNAGEWSLSRVMNIGDTTLGTKLPLYEFVDLPCGVPDSLIISMYLDGVDGVPTNLFTYEEIRRFMKAQAEGEDGPLLTDGRPNIFYYPLSQEEVEEHESAPASVAEICFHDGGWSDGPQYAIFEQQKGSRIFRRAR